MDDQRQNKPSGLPRPSKLPVQSKLPLPRSSLRPSPSRESLAGGSGIAGGSTLRNPKLRTKPSRDQLNTNAPIKPTLAAPTRAVSSPPARAPLNQNPGTSIRTSKHTSSNVTPSVQRTSRIGGAPAAGISSFGRSLNRRQSAQHLNVSSVIDEENVTPAPLALRSKLSRDNLGPSATRPSESPRPMTLSERTIETLSRLPSSPAMSGKAAASFYDQGSVKRPFSRPDSRAGTSRPSSSHQSDGSGRALSGFNSRPSSSSGPEDGISNFKSSINAYRNPMSPIDGTPTRGRGLPSANIPASITSTPGGTLRASATKRASGIPNVPARSRTPSPDKSTAKTPIQYGSKTITARPIRTRPSLNGLFRKASTQALNKSAAADASRKASTASRQSSATSVDGTNPSSASTTSNSTANTVDSTEGAATTYRKSSAALREQIAKAKAARKASARDSLAPNTETEPMPKSPLIPTDTTFDFGLASDPFNQNRDASSQAKVLQGRLESARTSGRLNIAAMGLKEIPAEVMNMYNLESIGGSGGTWAESVDLTRFVAADNELEMIDEQVFPDVDPQDLANDEDSQGNIFGGLETIDWHNNSLIAVPMGLRRLQYLTSLNLSQNQLANNCLEIISEITALRDLKLSGNLLYGSLDPQFSNLTNLEILDLHNNQIASLPSNFGNLSRLRILNVSENLLELLPFEILANMPLTELSARKNNFSGALIRDSTVQVLPSLQILDISSNQLTHLVRPGTGLYFSMPALHQLIVSMNRLECLPDISSWKNLVTLSADENNINAIPDGFTALEKLRSVDFSSNDIRVIPLELGLMDNLAMIRLSGNPLRDKKFTTIDTEELKSILAQRIPPPPAEEAPTNPGDNSPTAVRGGGASSFPNLVNNDFDDTRSDNDDFATPPTSAPVSPCRSRSHTVSSQTWSVKPGGVLDRSNTESSSLHPVICSKIATVHTVREIQLHHNLFTALPDSLSFFADTLTALSLAHNQLVGESYLGGASGDESLDLPALTELNLSSNHITGLIPLVNHMHAPSLQKLDLSCNRLSALPSGTHPLRETFPNLSVLLLSNNHLADLDPEAIKGLRVVDAANNDIVHLNPRIGLLAARETSGCGLERLEVSGNRFRVPRWNVLERGTEATLRWLRGRVPVAEMAAWREAEGGDGDDDDPIGDLD